MARVVKKSVVARKRHSEEFRKEALALAERVGVAKAAVQLGLTENQLYTWRRKAQRSADRSQVEQALSIENARLKRQLADQAEELAILKKAAAYFARSLK